MQVTEMHTEVIKHRIKDGGEDGIWETAGMAICLGVVQNYTFQEQDSDIERFENILNDYYKVVIQKR